MSDLDEDCEVRMNSRASRWTKKRHLRRHARVAVDASKRWKQNDDCESQDEEEPFPSEIFQTEEEGRASPSGVDLNRILTDRRPNEVRSDTSDGESCSPQLDLNFDEILNDPEAEFMDDDNDDQRERGVVDSASCAAEPVTGNEEDSDDGGEEHDKQLLLGDQEWLQHATPAEYAHMLVAAFYLKYQLSDAALSHFLKLQLAMQSKVAQLEEMRSPYMFLKKYAPLRKAVKKIYVCPACNKVLMTDDIGEPINNQPCGHAYSKESYDGCFVLVLPLAGQIQYFLENYDLQPLTDRDPNFRGDVNTGSFFRRYEKKGFIDQHTVTLQLNADGAQIFRSSKYSFWPFMAIINEAEYRVRRSNVILSALWYGNRKPPLEAFLRYPIEELNKTCANGISVNGVMYKIQPLIITVDSVARPILKNTTQHNGECGCDFCLHPGRVVKVGRGHARVYPEPASDEEPYKPRSLHQHFEDLQEVLDSGIAKHGIRGDTPLLHIPGFNFVRSFVPDYLHGVCLGVVRYFLCLWSAPKFSREPWSFRKKIKTFNRRLSLSKPPAEITRTPRTLENMSHWKASEFRTFALYYFPLLEGILPDVYYNHFLRLSYSLFILLQDRVHVKEIEKVKGILQQFVVETEQLYGIEHVKYNVHLLTHLAESVLNWGCLWASSTFIPESFNGQLTKLCNGTQAVVKQMADTFLMRNAVRSEVVSLMSQKALPPMVTNLFCELIDVPLTAKKQYGGLQVCNENQLLGRPSVQEIQLGEVEAIVKLIKDENARIGTDELVHNLSYRKAEVYKRAKTQKGVTYTSSSYTRSKKRVNSIVLLKTGNFFEIDAFVLFSGVADVLDVFCLGKVLGSDSRHCVFSSLIGEGSSVAGLTSRLRGKSETTVAFRLDDIDRKCVLASYNSVTDCYTVTALVNTKETD